MDAIQLGISTSYRWVSGRRRDGAVPDFQARDNDGDTETGTNDTVTSIKPVHRSRLAVLIPTPDGSGRVAPHPTPTSSVPPSTPVTTQQHQLRQYVVHDVSSGRRKSGRRCSRSWSDSFHGQSRSQPRSASASEHSVDATHQNTTGSGDDVIQTAIHTLEGEENKERIDIPKSQTRHRPRKSRRSPLSSLFAHPSRARAPSKPSPTSTSASTPPSPSPTSSQHKSFPFARITPAMVLENSGSVARDHLASERTFLAYVRTSLALSSTGVALVQLFTIADLTSRSTGVPLSSAGRTMQRFARPLGVTMVVLGLVVLGIAVYRYFLVQHSLPEKNFPVARFSIAFISFVLGASVVVIFGALLGGRVSG